MQDHFKQQIKVLVDYKNSIIIRLCYWKNKKKLFLQSSFKRSGSNSSKDQASNQKGYSYYNTLDFNNYLDDKRIVLIKDML